MKTISNKELADTIKQLARAQAGFQHNGSMWAAEIIDSNEDELEISVWGVDLLTSIRRNEANVRISTSSTSEVEVVGVASGEWEQIESAFLA
jgi:hypothetical protein